MKTILVIVIILITVFCFSFSEKHNKIYYNIYITSLEEFKSNLAALENTITITSPYSKENIQRIRKSIEAARLKLKNIDFWLRYFEPNAYRQINGPLAG